MAASWNGSLTVNNKSGGPLNWAVTNATGPVGKAGASGTLKRGVQTLKGLPVAAGQRLYISQSPLKQSVLAAKPALPSYEELYGLRAAAIAVYPMYKGLAQLAGMKLVGTSQTLSEQVDELAKCWQSYDFFFLHFKYTDSTGEDGAFPQKVKRIEELDAILPRIEALKPDVLIVTGDHSTPSKLKSHSWHPVPTLLVADTCRPDGLTKFSERDCLRGGFGIFPAKHLMLLAMAHAQRFGKYGA